MTSPMTDITFEQRTLRRLQFLQEGSIGSRYLEPEAEFMVALDHVNRRLRVQLAADVCAESPTTCVHRYFDVRVATWWDHWKMAHPRLAAVLRLSRPRFKRVERTITIDWRQHYPTIPAPARNGHPVPVVVRQISGAAWSMAPRLEEW